MGLEKLVQGAKKHLWEVPDSSIRRFYKDIAEKLPPPILELSTVFGSMLGGAVASTFGLYFYWANNSFPNSITSFAYMGLVLMPDIVYDSMLRHKSLEHATDNGTVPTDNILTKHNRLLRYPLMLAAGAALARTGFELYKSVYLGEPTTMQGLQAALLTPGFFLHASAMYLKAQDNPPSGKPLRERIGDTWSWAKEKGRGIKAKIPRPKVPDITIPNPFPEPTPYAPVVLQQLQLEYYV
jgi:hypothetical protein